MGTQINLSAQTDQKLTSLKLPAGGSVGDVWTLTNPATGDGAWMPASTPPFSPSDLPRLKLWLSADSGAYKDDGNTLAGNGESVQQWDDRSPNAQNASQATPLARPLFITNALNGKPVLRWDGIDDALNLVQPLSGSTQSLFVVVASPVRLSSVVMSTLVINGDRYIAVFNGGANLVRWSHFDPKNADSPTGFGSGFNIASAIQNGATATAYLNGVAGAPNAAMDTNDLRTIDTIGGYPSAIDSLQGDIAEIVYYDVSLNNANRIQVEAYLNSKYAIY